MLKEQWRRHKTPLRMVINSLIGIGIVLILNSSVLAETNNPKTLDSTDATDVIVVFVSGALGIVGGIVAAIFTSTQKIKELKEEFKLREKEQKREEIAKLRRDYLNPLRLSAEELKERLQILKDKQADNSEAARIRPWFVKIKDYITRDYRQDERFEFSNWCNGGEGYFAVSTLYLALAYFATATRIREEMPFTILVPKYNEYIKTITNHIEKIRTAFGGTYGIWEEIQDSIGKIALQPDGGIMDYKQFYTALMDDNICSAFLRMADYYVDFKDKDFKFIISF
ncbi:MAG: hypothetical protein LVS60_06300 [Nodosilinea sp. LVE1205-7]